MMRVNDIKILKLVVISSYADLQKERNIQQALINSPHTAHHYFLAELTRLGRNERWLRLI